MLVLGRPGTTSAEAEFRMRFCTHAEFRTLNARA